MLENTAKKVMSTFFKLKGIRAVPSRGAGPDFIVDGKAVEVKGTVFDLERALKQCWDYAQKYTEVAIVLPADSFDLDQLWIFYVLSEFVYRVRDFPLKFYLIAESEEEKDCYYVREYKDRMAFNGDVWSALMHGYIGFVETKPESSIDKAISNILSPKNLLIQSMIDECMKTMFKDVTKVQL
jgi:hypothetical protein